MSWRVSKTRQAAACGLLALFGAAFAVQADDRSVRPAAARHLIIMNATVVAVDAEAGTVTVNGGAIGKEHTFTVAAEARQEARGLEPGDEVVIALGAADTGEETVTRVMRSAADRPISGIDGTVRCSAHTCAFAPAHTFAFAPAHSAGFRAKRGTTGADGHRWGRFAIPARIPITIRA